MGFNRQQGMTLIELLVVMVLLAVVSTLLMQGLSASLATYERVQRRNYAGLPQMLAMRWFSGSVSALQAELDAPRQTVGDGTSLQGFSQQPLIGQSGEVQPIRWQLVTGKEGAVTLEYVQQGWHFTLLHWPVGTEAHFFYRDEAGGGHEQWPPAQNPAPLKPEGHIPSAVLLEVNVPGQPLLRWYVALTGRIYPRPDYREL